MSSSVMGALRPTISRREGALASAALLRFQQKPPLVCLRPRLSASRSRRPHLPRIFLSMSASSAAPDDTLKTVNVRIKGIVQGVCYRQWTVETARQLGLHGWVRNRSDGSVEAVFAGNTDVVDMMIECCRTGPRAANVNALDVSPTRETVGKGFSMRPTA